jgi:hypothetical protein
VQQVQQVRQVQQEQQVQQVRQVQQVQLLSGTTNYPLKIRLQRVRWVPPPRASGSGFSPTTRF